MQQQTISRSDCDVWHNVDFIWQPTQWLDQEETPKLFPKSNLHQKKKKKSHGHTWFSGPLPIWSTTIFWVLANPLHLRIMFSKLVRYAENCNAAAISQQKGPNSSPQQCLILRHTTHTSKIEWIWLRSFASSTIFTWALANWLPLLQASWQLFAGKPAGGRKCFPRVQHSWNKHRGQ